MALLVLGRKWELLKMTSRPSSTVSPCLFSNIPSFLLDSSSLTLHVWLHDSSLPQTQPLLTNSCWTFRLCCTHHFL